MYGEAASRPLSVSRRAHAVEKKTDYMPPKKNETLNLTGDKSTLLLTMALTWIPRSSQCTRSAEWAWLHPDDAGQPWKTWWCPSNVSAPATSCHPPMCRQAGEWCTRGTPYDGPGSSSSHHRRRRCRRNDNRNHQGARDRANVKMDGHCNAKITVPSERASEPASGANNRDKRTRVRGSDGRVALLRKRVVA